MHLLQEKIVNIILYKPSVSQTVGLDILAGRELIFGGSRTIF